MAGTPYKRQWLRRLAWLGFACAAVLTLASMASFTKALVYLGPSYHIMLIGGGLLIQPSPSPVNGGLQWADATIPSKGFSARLRGWFMFPRGMGTGSTFIPFGLPVAILAAVSWFTLRKARRRIAEGHCVQCGYDLTGNTSGRCSECGAVTIKTEV
ncbi:hypothetical protein B7486_16510 [cyanobacterium TDX16]|nr:hypothetical protein B7486_16510 [cyanobacterium TDX16]